MLEKTRSTTLRLFSRSFTLDARHCERDGDTAMSFDPQTVLPLIVCPGRTHRSCMREIRSSAPMRRLRLQYEIRDGIPVLLIDKATELTVEAWSAIMQRHGQQRDNRHTDPILQRPVQITYDSPIADTSVAENDVWPRRRGSTIAKPQAVVLALLHTRISEFVGRRR